MSQARDRTEDQGGRCEGANGAVGAGRQDGSNPRDLSDERLLARCRWEAFRGSGPGGQKRNKTSSAVRVTDGPTGLSATAGESRSQGQNRRRAFERLRRRIVLELRRPVPADGFAAPAWFAALLVGGRLRVPPRHDRYLATVGLVLDVVAAAGGSVSEAASLLGVTTANLVDFLQRDGEALARVNQLRAGEGLKPLGGA